MAGGRNDVFNFVLVELEVLVEHPKANVEQTVGYEGLEGILGQ